VFRGCFEIRILGGAEQFFDILICGSSSADVQNSKTLLHCALGRVFHVSVAVFCRGADRTAQIEFRPFRPVAGPPRKAL